MADVPNASVAFLPWVRQGAAAAINVADTLGPNMRGAVDLKATLAINNVPGNRGHGAAAGSGGCRRHRPARDRAHGSQAGHDRLRAELFSGHRVRPARLPLAVHAGEGRCRCEVAAVVVPGRRASAGRRDSQQLCRIAAGDPEHRRRCEPGRRAAGSGRFVGVGARASRGGNDVPRRLPIPHR